MNPEPFYITIPPCISGFFQKKKKAALSEGNDEVSS